MLLIILEIIQLALLLQYEYDKGFKKPFWNFLREKEND